MIVSKNYLKTLKNEYTGDIKNNFFIRCFFCENYKKITSEELRLVKSITLKKENYCSFCVRNNFYNKSNKNILILNFKKIINSIYEQEHLKKETMWISEIKDLIEEHKKSGCSNPVFLYDEESLDWFVDFNKVGKQLNSIEVKDINNTIMSIIDSLKVNVFFGESVNTNLQKKYIDALNLFYNKRYRPKNKKILSPSLNNVNNLYENLLF